jgi:hypothetical protein
VAQNGDWAVAANWSEGVPNDASTSFAAHIAGMRAGDVINPKGSNAMSGVCSNGILTVTASGFGTIAHLAIAGHFTPSSFHFATDGHGGTNLTV